MAARYDPPYRSPFASRGIRPEPFTPVVRAQSTCHGRMQWRPHLARFTSLFCEPRCDEGQKRARLHGPAIAVIAMPRDYDEIVFASFTHGLWGNWRIRSASHAATLQRILRGNRWASVALAIRHFINGRGWRRRT